jgi:hypothetical protein
VTARWIQWRCRNGRSPGAIAIYACWGDRWGSPEKDVCMDPGRGLPRALAAGECRWLTVRRNPSGLVSSRSFVRPTSSRAVCVTLPFHWAMDAGRSLLPLLVRVTRRLCSRRLREQVPVGVVESRPGYWAASLGVVAVVRRPSAHEQKSGRRR